MRRRLISSDWKWMGYWKHNASLLAYRSLTSCSAHHPSPVVITSGLTMWACGPGPSGPGKPPAAGSREHGSEPSRSTAGGNFLTGWTVISFSRRTMLHGVSVVSSSKLYKHICCICLCVCVTSTSTQGTNLVFVFLLTDVLPEFPDWLNSHQLFKVHRAGNARPRSVVWKQSAPPNLILAFVKRNLPNWHKPETANRSWHKGRNEMIRKERGETR
jgi:hypothetical protein